MFTLLASAGIEPATHLSEHQNDKSKIVRASLELLLHESLFKHII